MNLKKQILTLAAVACCVMSASAFDLFKKGSDAPFDYSAWRDTISLPSTADGITLFYPSTVDGNAVVSGTIKVNGKTAEQIMTGAIAYVLENIDTENEQIGEISHSGNAFTVRLYSKQGSNNTETTYTRLMRVETSDGAIRFTTTELDAKYREKGLIPRTLPFEKLNPATNTRHRELIDEFVRIHSGYLDEMARYAAGFNEKVTHWNDIENGNVVLGMTPFEVKIIHGSPVASRESGNRLRWVYSNDYVLLFTNGKLTRIVE